MREKVEVPMVTHISPQFVVSSIVDFTWHFPLRVHKCRWRNRWVLGCKFILEGTVPFAALTFMWGLKDIFDDI